ncbi:MAG: tRNA (adenosine(37)-N6)-dimethylallyltransferase MiaA [Bacilli bacterium]|nr:tRNA (adenosine(37)-N6)-dimethylallyltransferase MiaA [Bacilli bacterium]
MIYVIFGPTCSGKTSLAVDLANNLKAPIVNADAFQIYKDMNIGTAKISKSNPAYKFHYLIDIITPDKSFSVKEYQSLFRDTINELNKTNKDIIVVGGTGLYIRASLYDYEFGEEIETNYEDLLNMDNKSLKTLLDSLDMEASNKIHVNNRKRLIRAISLIRNQNKTKSDIINSQEHKVIYPNVKFYFLNPDRNLLYENINKRVDDMFDNGLVDEVKNLMEKYPISMTALQGIGYKETVQFLNGELSLNECKELIKKRTRNYAKRQVTFFKNQFKYEEFADKNDIYEVIMNEK